METFEGTGEINLEWLLLVTLLTESGPTARRREDAPSCPPLVAASLLSPRGSCTRIWAQRQQVVTEALRPGQHRTQQSQEARSEGLLSHLIQISSCAGTGILSFLVFYRWMQEKSVFFLCPFLSFFPFYHSQLLETFSTLEKWQSWKRKVNLSQCHFHELETFVKLQSRKGGERVKITLHILHEREEEKKKERKKNPKPMWHVLKIYFVKTSVRVEKWI